MLRLVIKEPAGERSFVTERSEILLGRREDVDLVVQDPAASRSHCMLRVDGESVKLVDLGTVNGTLLGGRRVDQASLAAGDEFVIGKTTVRVVAFGSPVVPPAPPEAAAARAELEPEPPVADVPKPPVPTGAGRSEFSRELRAMISRAPWYLVSLIVHVLALMVLDLVTFSRIPVGVQARLEAARPGALPKLDETLELPEPDLEALEPDFEEDLAVSDDEPKPPEKGGPSPMDLEPELKLGASGPIRPIRLRTPLPVKPKVAGAGDKVDTTNLDQEHRGAADVVREGLTRAGRGIPRGIPADRILIVEGEFDKMERVLDAYRIRYTLIQRADLLRRKYPRAKLLCINCARPVRQLERAKLVATVKAFVQRGGWLITSDWSLEPYLTAGFPDRVRKRETKRQPDTTVTVRQTSTSPILDGVFSRRARTDWWLEETSTMFDVTSDTVNVLVVSDDMQRRFGAQVVAFDFLSGQGRVLHLLGHFYQKDGNKMGIVGMHRLILNYIHERFPSRSSR